MTKPATEMYCYIIVVIKNNINFTRTVLTICWFNEFEWLNAKEKETLTKNFEINIGKHITVDVGGVTLNDQVVMIVQLHEGYVVSIRFYKASTLNDRNGRFFECKIMV